MLEVELRDGTRFYPGRDKVKVVLEPVEEGGAEREFEWADIAAVFMVEPTIFVGQGLFKPPGSTEGMPIRSLRLVDPSDFAVDVPMPIAEAEELSKRLASPKVEIASRIPSGLVLPR